MIRQTLNALGKDAAREALTKRDVDPSAKEVAVRCGVLELACGCSSPVIQQLFSLFREVSFCWLNDASAAQL